MFLTLVLTLFLVLGLPVSATTSYSYSIFHISDTQKLSENHPETLNHTFSSLESLKSFYNISAIIISGDLVNDGNDVSQWINYVNARSKTTIPVYEIPGDHDLVGETANNPLFDKFVGNKTDWTATIEDFVFIGIGYRENPLNNPDIAQYQAVIEENSQKFTLVAVHNYYDENFTISLLGSSIRDNLVLKPTFVMSGHAHTSIIHSGFVNNISYVEDSTNYQNLEDFAAGRLYTVYITDKNTPKITVRDVFIFPVQYITDEEIIYPLSGETFYSYSQEMNLLHSLSQMEDYMEENTVPFSGPLDGIEDSINSFLYPLIVEFLFNIDE